MELIILQVADTLTSKLGRRGGGGGGGRMTTILSHCWQPVYIYIKAAGQATRFNCLLSPSCQLSPQTADGYYTVSNVGLIVMQILG